MPRECFQPISDKPSTGALESAAFGRYDVGSFATGPRDLGQGKRAVPGDDGQVGARGCSTMVVQQPSKLNTRVRFPSPAFWIRHRPDETDPNRAIFPVEDQPEVFR